MFEAEPLAASVGVAALSKQNRQCSGDRVHISKRTTAFSTCLLSDGMGTGEGAARYSGDAVRILERFLSGRAWRKKRPADFKRSDASEKRRTTPAARRWTCSASICSAAIRRCTSMVPLPPMSGRAKQSTGSAGRVLRPDWGPSLNVPDYLKIQNGSRLYRRHPQRRRHQRER